MRTQVIHLHPDAPAKPAEHAPCNGCGVCCASAPCPLGVLVSRRTHGACAALLWNEVAGLYRCGLIDQPAEQLPRPLQMAAPLLAPIVARIAKRYIAAGAGCDCNIEPVA